MSQALTDEQRSSLRGKMNVEIGQMVLDGDLSRDAAAQFLLERAIAKAERRSKTAA